MDKTLLKGLMVLEAVTDVVDPPQTIDDVAKRVGLTRSNTHRTLQTLIHAGFAYKCGEGGGYRGGIRLFEMAARQLGSIDMRRVAAPYMRELAAQTGETVHLSVLDGLDVVYIDKIDSPRPVRAYTMVGGRAPAYAVATGKALLAHQRDSYLDPYADALIRHTSATVGTLTALKDELRKTVRLGYATNRGEWRESVGGIAVAVFNALDEPIAAIGISGPIERFTAAETKRWAPAVQACAAEVSRQLGFKAP